MKQKKIEKLYLSRFDNHHLKMKQKIWEILTKDFFQKYVSPNDTVLDVGAGFCEFINNIKAKKKIAIDLQDITPYAAKGVTVIKSASTDMHMIKSNSINIVFLSNFLEHLTVSEIEQTLKEIRRVLIDGGKLLILQPNIKYAYSDYWDFFDHITPLSHLSTKEALINNGFEIIEIKPRFLPYSTRSKFSKLHFLIKIYLKINILQKIFGKQMFICAKKDNKTLK